MTNAAAGTGRIRGRYGPFRGLGVESGPRVLRSRSVRALRGRV